MAPRRWRAPDVVEGDQAHQHHAESRVEPLLDGVGDHVLGGVPVEHEELGAVCRGEEHVGEEIAAQGPEVAGGHHHAIHPGLQAAARKGDDQVAEKAEVGDEEEVPEGKGERGREMGQVLDEPGQADRHHELTGAVVRATPPCRAAHQHIGQPARDVEGDGRGRLTAGMVQVGHEPEEGDDDPDHGCRKRQHRRALATGCGAGKGGRLDHGGIVTRAVAGRAVHPQARSLPGVAGQRRRVGPRRLMAHSAGAPPDHDRRPRRRGGAAR
jgi:hypothetical protein